MTFFLLLNITQILQIPSCFLRNSAGSCLHSIRSVTELSVRHLLLGLRARTKMLTGDRRVAWGPGARLHAACCSQTLA